MPSPVIAIDHPKMKRLCRTLKIPLPYANGILQRLWIMAAINSPDGGIGRHSDDEIAAWCGVELQIEPELLTQSLIGAGWLDPAPNPVRFRLHDWPDHCGHRVHRKLATAGQPFADGHLPSFKGLSRKERQRSIARFEKHGVDVSGAGLRIRPLFRLGRPPEHPRPGPPVGVLQGPETGIRPQ